MKGIKFMDTSITAEAALARLREGNAEYAERGLYTGNVSPEIRHDLKEHGQHPYACIITCSDSRVVPESAFSASLGQLFVIRIAGNVIDEYVLGSVEYAAEHLGTPLVVVLGHTECGAVAAALGQPDDTHVGALVSEIQDAIGSERDPDYACHLNVQHSVDRIRNEISLSGAAGKRVRIIGAVYNIESGKVDFFKEGLMAPLREEE